MAEPGYSPPEQVVARRIQKLEERLNRLERPTGSQNNRNKDKVEAALADLQAQAEDLRDQAARLEEQAALQQDTIDYLSALKTYSASDTNTIGNTNAGSNYNHPEQSPQLSFTLTETMKVRLTLRASSFLAASGAASAVVVAQTTMSLRIGGAVRNDSTVFGALNQMAGPAGVNQSASASGELTSELILTLGPGTYDIGSAYTSYGVGASVTMQISDRTLSAQILGRP